MAHVHETSAEDYEEFCKNVQALFDDMDDVEEPHRMTITFPEEEFPLLPLHTESEKTMTSINSRVIDFGTVVKLAAKKKMIAKQLYGLEALRQYNVYPAEIEEGSGYSFRLERDDSAAG